MSTQEHLRIRGQNHSRIGWLKEQLTRTSFPGTRFLQNSMLSNTSVQGQGQSNHRQLECHITGEANIFLVTLTLESNLEVADLREVIQSARALDILQDVGAHAL